MARSRFSSLFVILSSFLGTTYVAAQDTPPPAEGSPVDTSFGVVIEGRIVKTDGKSQGGKGKGWDRAYIGHVPTPADKAGYLKMTPAEKAEYAKLKDAKTYVVSGVGNLEIFELSPGFVFVSVLEGTPPYITLQEWDEKAGSFKELPIWSANSKGATKVSLLQPSDEKFTWVQHFATSEKDYAKTQTPEAKKVIEDKAPQLRDRIKQVIDTKQLGIETPYLEGSPVTPATKVEDKKEETPPVK